MVFTHVVCFAQYSNFSWFVHMTFLIFQTAPAWTFFISSCFHFMWITLFAHFLFIFYNISMITKKQKMVLDFITDYQERKEYAPSLDEIRKKFKLASVSTAHFHISKLRDLGYLTKEENKSRSIDVVGRESMVKIPLLGTIAAGQPIEAIQVKEIMAVPKSKIPQSSEVYALRVVGNSMIDENIRDGDVVLVKQQEVAENGQRVVALIDNYEATLKKFDIIYADPPWYYNGKMQFDKSSKSKEKIDLTRRIFISSATFKYPTLKTNELMKLPVRKIAKDDCLLFMWTSNPHLAQAIELGEAWGFEYKTVAFVWDKMNHNPGQYTLSNCELCLVFKRGRIPKPRGARNVKQLVRTPRKEHSEKPIDVIQAIEKMFPTQERIELFARRKTDGWSVWGLDVIMESNK